MEEHTAENQKLKHKVTHDIYQVQGRKDEGENIKYSVY